jgi:putative MATE family efflux protein
MNRDLTVGNPSKVLVDFCLPLFGSIVFQQLYNIADSFVAGKFISEEALAAVGNSYEITLIFIAFAFGCNIGCSVVASRLFGAKDYTNVKSAIYTSLISTVATCAILMFIGLFSMQGLLNLINTPENIYEDSALYLSIYIWGLPFLFLYNVSTGIFSAFGDSRTPFIFLALSSTANIFMDILFVTAFQMGVAGVAWATFICQGISAVLALIFVLKRLTALKAPEKPVLFSKSLFKAFISIAIPSTLQQSFVSVGNIILQGIINSFGSSVVAGYSAAIKLNNLVITSLTTIGNGVSNFTAQNMGAKKPDRVLRGWKSGIKMVWIVSIPFILLYMLLPETLIKLFVDNPSAISLETGRQFLRIVSIFYLVVSVKIISDAVLKGAGNMTSFMISTFSDLIIRVGLAYILSRSALQVTGIWLSWPIGWAVGTILSLTFFKANTKNLK